MKSLLSSSITNSEHDARLPCTHILATRTSCVATVVRLSASVTVTRSVNGTSCSFIRSATLRRTKQHEAPVSISMSTHLAPSTCPRATIVLLLPRLGSAAPPKCSTLAPLNTTAGWPLAGDSLASCWVMVLLVSAGRAA